MNQRLSLQDDHGTPLQLTLLGTGGEGSVYRVMGRTEVAKVWHAGNEEQRREKELKLRHMVRMHNDRVSEVCTWPKQLVMDHGQVVGYTMQALPLGTKSLADLSSRRTRCELGDPWNSFGFLVVIAAKMAQAVAVLNSTQVLFADFNPSNIHVTPTGAVWLIDPDGYEFNIKGTRFANRAVRPEFLAPELIGTSGQARTVHHEAFGLAVAIFKLLFQGCSPMHQFDEFGNELDDFAATVKGRFVLDVPDRDPTAPTEDIVGPAVLKSFRAAFARGTVRPAAADWHAKLLNQVVRLQHCPKNPKHHFDQMLRACPWCAMHQRNRFDYFSG